MSLKFIPFVRQQLSAWASRPDRSCAVAVAEVGPDGVTEVHKPVEIKVELLDPRDIVGFVDPDAPGYPIAAVSPAPDATGVKVTIFPCVDFKDIDFPWRYSYASRRSTSNEPSEDGPRLAPWLILLVLPRDRYELRTAPGRGEAKHIARYVRPKPGAVSFDAIRKRSWAWAHVQLTDPPGSGSLKSQLESTPTEQACSRLICPVFLEPNTAYTAFLIPADNDAWTPNGEREGTVDHPIFHAWSFSTGEQPGLESLLARIEGGDIDDCVLTIEGDERVDFHHVAAGRVAPGGNQFGMPGALQPADAPAWRFEAEHTLLEHCREAWLEATIALQGCRRCRHIAKLPLRDCEGVAIKDVTVQPPTGGPHAAAAMTELDPYVGLPHYGSFHAAGQVPTPDEAVAMSAVPWPYEANLATRRRIAAGLGAEVVRRHQDELVARYAAQERAETARHTRELGRFLNGGLWQRHGGSVDAARYVARVAPVAASSDVEPLHRTALHLGSLSAASRKLLHQKAGRRGAAPPEPAYQEYLDRRLTEKIASSSKGRPRVYDATVDDLRDTLRDINDPREVRATIDHGLAAAMLGEQGSDRAPTAPTPRIDYPMYRYLMELSRDYLIPRLDSLSTNRLVLLRPDVGFIKAYMLGLNHEMVRELIWREYPIAPTCTVFRYFWDKDDHALGPDIDDIDHWDVRAPLDAPMSSGAAVLSAVLIKADLVKHSHDVTIQVVQVTGAADRNAWIQFLDGKQVPGFEPVQILFHCPLADDTVLLGLPIALDLRPPEPTRPQAFLIFSENPARPHFGLPLWQKPGPIGPDQLARNLVHALPVGEGITWMDPDKGLHGDVAVAGYGGDPRVFWSHSARVARCSLQRPIQLQVPFHELVQRRRR